MPAKKLIIALLIIVVAVGGFVAGLFLLRERQDLQEEAAVPGGQAEVSIVPSTGDFEVGETISTSVSFNPANISISGIEVRLTYPFSGSTPEITVSSITLSSAITSSADWSCPTKTSTQQGSNVVIDIGCANISGSGFTANTDTLLADIELLVNREPLIEPVVVRFDPTLSRITRKSDNTDILLIPSSTGSYTIGGAVAPTTAPTTALTQTPTPTRIATTSATITTTPTRVASPSATTGTLPDAGVSYPTLFGIGLGVMVVVGSLLLAL